MCTAEDMILVSHNNEQSEDIVLTRQCNKVIKCLYKRRLSNKDLAQSLGVSASALSNSLQKIRSANSNFLIIEQIGRNTYYSLSELGEAYVESNLMNNRIIIIDEKVSHRTQRAFSLLKEMKDTWGEDWDLKFDELLLYYTKGEDGKADKCFIDFIHVIENLFLEERWDELNSIYDMLDVTILKKRIKKYFDRIIGIKCLCDIDDIDWKLAYQMVDNFFENKGEKFYLTIYKKIDEYQLSYESINLIFSSLNELLNEDTNDVMEKETFYDKLGNVFMSHERLMYYIVEKYITQKRRVK